MTYRVTVGSTQASSLASLQAASARYDALSQKLSTGKQIGVPSDDPAGAVEALRLRADLARNAQYERNSSDATGWLDAADTAYGQITDLVQKVRTLTVQASNTGASTGSSAEAIAQQIDSIRTAAIKLANTTYNGRPIFGGTTSGTIAYNDDGSYAGDDGTVQRAIGDQNTIQINQTGNAAFGPDGSSTNVFTLLANISSTLSSTGAPPTDALANLDTALNNLSAARSASGAALSQVQSAQVTQQSNDVSLQTNKSQIEDIDLAQVAVQVNTANVVYQAALQTTANIKQLSLLNFLR